MEIIFLIYNLHFKNIYIYLLSQYINVRDNNNYHSSDDLLTTLTIIQSIL